MGFVDMEVVVVGGGAKCVENRSGVDLYEIVEQRK